MYEALIFPAFIAVIGFSAGFLGLYLKHKLLSKK